MTPHDNTPDLQPTQDIDLHTIHISANAKSTKFAKHTHLGTILHPKLQCLNRQGK